MSVAGSMLMSYDLDYEDLEDDPRIVSSRLVAITQTGYDGSASSSLPPTTFTYTTPYGGFEDFDEWNSSLTNFLILPNDF